MYQKTKFNRQRMQIQRQSHLPVAAEESYEELPQQNLPDQHFVKELMSGSARAPKTAQQVIQLQHAVGNQAVMRMLGVANNNKAKDEVARTISPTDTQIQRVIRWRTSSGNKRRYFSSLAPSKSFATRKRAEQYEASLGLSTSAPTTSSIPSFSFSPSPISTPVPTTSSTSPKKRKKRQEVDTSLILSDTSRKKKVRLDKLPLHFEDPSYTAEPSHAHAGGSRSTAILGPRSLKGMGSDADSSLPTAITKAREKYPIRSFKAGHLLNADFFGSGTDAHNLTILTAAANGSMRTFDNNVKYAVEQLQKLYEVMSDAYIDIDPVRYGVKVVIDVSTAKWGGVYPDNCIANSVTCVASLSGTLPDLSTAPTKTQLEIATLAQKVSDYVDLANGGSHVNNT